METALVGALALLAYTYAGYPFVIWLLGQSFPRPVHRRAFEPRVAVVIVAHNEAPRLARKLDTCIAVAYPRERLRILVVSDGSDDTTDAIARAYADRGVDLLAFPVRRGKAACLNDAVAACDEEIVVFTDARQRLDPDAIRYLAENFADPAVGAASGALVFETAGISGFGEGVDAYWRYEKFIREQESRVHSTVGVTGALYALRRECFRSLPTDTILDDVVIPMNVVMQGRRVVFEKRAMAFDTASRDYRHEKLRKVRTLAGNYQLIVSHPRYLVPLRNPVLLQLVSHKMLRLAAPFFMALLLVASVVLAPRSWVYQLLLAAQVAAYAVPAAGVLWPPARAWKAVKLATAFLSLNWFAVLGMVEFARNRNAHLWGASQKAGG
jgi:biofilm PGA synthesis N-glycosyltransferase PgaC